MKNCPFCENRRKEFLKQNKYKVDEMYFIENDVFSISSDLSPLTTGHLLVIPLKHYASFGEIADSQLLDEIHRKAEELLGTKDLLYFEHGAVIEGEGGASVDHAHLHVMPRPESMDVRMIDEYIISSGSVHSEKRMASHSTLQELYKQEQPYIYYQIEGVGWVYPVHQIPHQFLRLMLQKYCSISYNWRETFESEECRKNVDKTIAFVQRNSKG